MLPIIELTTAHIVFDIIIYETLSYRMIKLGLDVYDSDCFMACVELFISMIKL